MTTILLAIDAPRPTAAGQLPWQRGRPGRPSNVPCRADEATDAQGNCGGHGPLSS
jgi:hypothetical protein